MPSVAVSVELSNREHDALRRHAAVQRSTVDALTRDTVVALARGLAADYERALLQRIPEAWANATPEEQAALIATVEAMLSR